MISNENVKLWTAKLGSVTCDFVDVRYVGDIIQESNVAYIGLEKDFPAGKWVTKPSQTAKMDVQKQAVLFDIYKPQPIL